MKNTKSSHEMKSLVEKLNKYRNAYYNDNISLVSDIEYDRLFDQLCTLEQETGIVYANSPTCTVGYTAISKLKKVEHSHPLLSLAKTTDINEFANYFADKPTVVMAKMDGLTCSITYRNGELVLAESRGDGETGEDITHNALTFTNLPKRIPYLGELVVDGECIIDKNTFKEINTPLKEKAEIEAVKLALDNAAAKEYVRKHSYANPRNLVSGTVRQLDSKIAAQRNVKFIAWKLHSALLDGKTNDSVCNSHESGFRFLESLCFTTVPYYVGHSDQFKTYIELIKSKCEELQYPIDGIVGMFDDISFGNSLGSTSHHPKHSLAFKFEQEKNKTTLLDIEWSTSRTGLVNPVAIVEPIEIDGTTVSRATLSNASIIKELELGIGDEIVMIKANQIIPQIIDNLTRSNTYKMPSTCPSCGKPIVIKNDNGRELLYCTNDRCEARLNDKISHFVSKDALNIVGISQERLRILMQYGFVSDFASIYSLHLHRAELEKISGLGKSSVGKLLAAIDDSRRCKFSDVIVGLGIPGVGKSTAKSLAKHCAAMSNGNVIQKLLECAENNYDWSTLEDFGTTMSNAVNEYLITNKDEIAALAPILEIEDSNTQSMLCNKFAGKSFCITGKLNLFPNRESLVSEIEKYGGKIVSGVTAKTSYLITNDRDSGSSKNLKAIKHGTLIISEEDFLSMCNR